MSLKNDVIMSIDLSEQCDIVNLYLVGEEQLQNAYLPFLQNITLAGPKGEVVWVTALFDEGAMVSVMCSSFFEKVKHRLRNWIPSAKCLRMANGTIIPSCTTWKGEIEIVGTKAHGEFKVFDSGGGWKFLFGKPMLHVFKVVHDYRTDEVDITGIGGT
jgi:hypothetical protein